MPHLRITLVLILAAITLGLTLGHAIGHAQTIFAQWEGDDNADIATNVTAGTQAVHQWHAPSQRWLSWFPDGHGLGVNTLTRLKHGGIYTLVGGEFAPDERSVSCRDIYEAGLALGDEMAKYNSTLLETAGCGRHLDERAIRFTCSDIKHFLPSVHERWNSRRSDRLRLEHYDARMLSHLYCD